MPSWCHRLSSEGSVVGYRKPVRLVAYLLDEERRLLVPVERQGMGEPGHEDLLLALGDGHDRNPEPEFPEHRTGRRKLPLSAVDDDQVREVASLPLQPRVAPPDHFGDGGEVVDALDRAYLKAPVVPLIRSSPPEP